MKKAPLPPPFELWIGFLIIVLITILIVAIFAVKAYRQRREVNTETYIRKHSKRYLAAVSLRNNSGFDYSIKGGYTTYYHFYKKPEFDRFTSDAALISMILKHDFFEDIIDGTLENQRVSKIEAFQKGIENLPPIMQCSKEIAKENKLSYKKYCDIEEKLCSEQIVFPVSDPKFLVKNEYTSPKGRSVLHSAYGYTFDAVLKMTIRIKEINEEMNSAEYRKKVERSKMSQSLRYDILKRDGFRCVLCGRSAREHGVELEVDHIIPVSKGGKTEPDNLRTLCKDCNRGKRDKDEIDSSEMYSGI